MAWQEPHLSNLLSSVVAIKRHRSSGPASVALGEIETPIVKPGGCWEASDGRVYCAGNQVDHDDEWASSDSMVDAVKNITMVKRENSACPYEQPTTVITGHKRTLRGTIPGKSALLPLNTSHHEPLSTSPPGKGFCQLIAKDYYFCDGNAAKCHTEVKKGPYGHDDVKGWDRKLMTKCYDPKSLICPIDPWPTPPPMVKRVRPTVNFSIPGTSAPLISIRSHQEALIISTVGMGKCEIVARAYWSEGYNDNKCNKEVKKGPRKWKQSLVEKCFDLDNIACY
ncbi:MAG: hypothetical protein Q9170_002084 [Blastenia crenularia]